MLAVQVQASQMLKFDHWVNKFLPPWILPGRSNSRTTPILIRRPWRAFLWCLAILAIAVVAFALWGERLLTANDPPPARVDVAIVLQGSIAAEKARVGGAIHLLNQGTADRILLSVPKESYWGQSIPPIARAYLERTYGSENASRIDFCETDPGVDSTLQEMQALLPCIEAHHWHSIVVVTSSYHTRRAGMIWRKGARRSSELKIWIEGIDDPEFQSPWWRHRQSAKVFVMESTKLVWAALGR